MYLRSYGQHKNAIGETYTGKEHYTQRENQKENILKTEKKTLSHENNTHNNTQPISKAKNPIVVAQANAYPEQQNTENATRIPEFI